MRKLFFLIGFLTLLSKSGYTQCGISVSITTTWRCDVVSGSIIVSTAGGTLPYKYSIDFGTLQPLNFFSNVPSGFHHIKVEDALGCSWENDVSLTPNSNLSGTVDLSEITCGKFTVTPYAGFPPYLISINGGPFQSINVFTNLNAGTYNILIKDASSCITSVPPIIIASNPLTATTSKINTLCPGSNTGSITVNATNGTPPYSYSINGGGSYQTLNTFTGLGSGTYNFIVKDINGCKFSISETILNGLSGVTATSSTQNAACNGSATGSITITPTVGVAPFKYSLDGGTFQNSNIFTGVLAGAHSILVTDVNGCTATVTTTVGNNPGITAAINTTNTACSGSPTGTIEVTSPTGTAPYAYSLDNLISQGSNIFSGLNAGTYSVHVTDGNGCSVTLPALISNGSGITATASTQNAPCSSSPTGKITVNTLLGSAPFSFSIDGGLVQSSNIFNDVLPGSHAIFVKDANGCSYSFNAVVNTDPAVTATFTSQNTACLTSSSGSITTTASLGVSPYSYSLNGSTFQASNIFSGLPAANYTIIVKDAAGCIFTGSQAVVSNSGVTASTTSVNTACGTATTGIITVNASAGILPYLYSLDGGSFQVSNIFTSLGSGLHAIQVKDGVGCIFSGSPTVGSNLGVTASSDIINAGCPGSATGSVTVNASAGVAPYLYSFNGGAFQSSNIFTGLNANTYNIKVKDAANCMFNFTSIVNNDPLVSATLNVIKPSCYGTATGNITVSPILGRSPYQFALDNGSYQNGNSFNNLLKGNYMVHIKDANGCIKDTLVTIDQPSLLTGIADTIASSCKANDGTITVAASGGTLPFQYSSDGINYQPSNILKVSPGVYNVFIKDNNGCIANTPAKVSLIDDMFLSLGNDTTTCSGVPVTFTPVTNSATNIFTWSPNNGNLNTSTGAYTVSPSDTTNYVLNATYGVCHRTDNIILNILRKPIADAGKDTTICANTPAFLHGYASNKSGSVNYLWSPQNDLSSTSTDTTTATPTTFGSHTYTLEVTDNYGCNFKVTDAVVVTLNTPPPAFAGNDTIAAINLPHQLWGSGGVNYSWSPGSLLNNPNSKNPIATLNKDTKFILTVTDNAGCSSTDTVNIKVYAGPTYYVPNAFTPNGDGLNDVFRAIPPGITSTDYFRIFNRWGQLVFETRQYLKGWDGTYIGKPQPNGPYLWEIKGKDKFGKVVEMKGSLVLIR